MGVSNGDDGGGGSGGGGSGGGGSGSGGSGGGGNSNSSSGDGDNSIVSNKNIIGDSDQPMGKTAEQAMSEREGGASSAALGETSKGKGGIRGGGEAAPKFRTKEVVVVVATARVVT